MKLSSRLSHSAPNALSLLLNEKRASGERVLDLTESNPTRAGIHYPSDFLSAFSAPRALLYEPEPFGLPAARERIALEYGAPPGHVILTTSTSEAYSWLFKLLCDPGCEVLAPRPSYPLFDFLASLESVVLRHYPLFYDHGWCIDFHALEQSIGPLTRAIVLVNPNNPTGHFIRRRELAQLLALCQDRDIALISDEVFADYTVDPPSDAVLTLRGVADFALNGLSKLVGLPQMKLGWIVSKRPVPELEIVADTYLSVGTPVQLALPAMLELREPVQRQILARLRRNLSRLRSTGLRHLRVEGGWYAILPVMDEEETAERLLRERNVLTQPGFFYDFEKSGYLVLSLLTPPEIFDEGIEAIQVLGSPRFP